MNCDADPLECAIASGTVEVDGMRPTSVCGKNGALSAGKPSNGTGGKDVTSKGTFNKLHSVSLGN